MYRSYMTIPVTLKDAIYQAPTMDLPSVCSLDMV